MNTSITGCVKRNALTQTELDQIKKLEEACTSYEPISIKLNWSILKTRPENEHNDYLFFTDGELVGFLGLFSFGADEVEVSGMVHPAYRRRGIFTQMLHASIKDCVDRSFKQMLLICPGGSTGGEAFCKKNSEAYSFSEYFMIRKYSPVEPSSLPIQLRVADEKDIDIISQLYADAFSMSIEDAAKFSSRFLSRKNENVLIAELDGKTIGKIGLQVSDTDTFILGFAVFSEFRGRGYGRSILLQTLEYCQNVLNKPDQSLEVAAKNERALPLYTSCGFKEKSRIDYYLLKL